MKKARVIITYCTIISFVSTNKRDDGSKYRSQCNRQIQVVWKFQKKIAAWIQIRISQHVSGTCALFRFTDSCSCSSCSIRDEEVIKLSEWTRKV